MTSTVNPDSIPRYKEPTFEELCEETDEPDRGSCWNCGHMCECRMFGMKHTLCARERDAGNDNELEHITMLITECADWVHFVA